MMYDGILVLPNWVRQVSGTITARVTARVESTEDGSPRGAKVAWREHEVLAGQLTLVGKPLSLQCAREEGLALRFTVRLRAMAPKLRARSAATESAGGRAARDKSEPIETTVSGSLLLDAVPLELLEPRKVTLLDGAEASRATAKSMNAALLRGERWGEIRVRFLPEPPRVKTVFFVRHAESEWNEVGGA